MTLDELLADRDAGLGYLMHGMGFSATEAAHLLDLLAAEHAEQHPDQPPAPGVVGIWPRRRDAPAVPRSQTTPAVGPARTADRRRPQVAREAIRCLVWTVLAWRGCCRPTTSRVLTWTEPGRTNLQRQADDAAQRGDR